MRSFGSWKGLSVSTFDVKCASILPVSFWKTSCGQHPGGGQKARGYSTSFPLWDSYVAWPSFHVQIAISSTSPPGNLVENSVVNQGKLVTTRHTHLWTKTCSVFLLVFLLHGTLFTFYITQAWFFVVVLFFGFTLYWIRQHFAKQSWQGTLTVFLLLRRLKCDLKCSGLHFVSVWPCMDVAQINTGMLSTVDTL